MNRYRLIAALLVAGSLVSPAQEFSSGPQNVTLIELYTSEGCSCCPPADRKLNALADKEGLWTDFVPVAFHVDYWNHLGWKDPYSSTVFSTRQRRYTREWSARTSYTPCFMANGTASRNLQHTRNRSDKPGILQASLTDHTATISFAPRGPKIDFTAWLASLSGSLTNTITAGENRGQTLQHNFVALGLASGPMKSDRGTFTATLDIPQDSRTQAIAVWVSYRNFLKPIQATGGWME